jgi:hypothetical protein
VAIRADKDGRRHYARTMEVVTKNMEETQTSA